MQGGVFSLKLGDHLTEPLAHAGLERRGKLRLLPVVLGLLVLDHADQLHQPQHLHPQPALFPPQVCRRGIAGCRVKHVVVRIGIRYNHRLEFGEIVESLWEELGDLLREGGDLLPVPPDRAPPLVLLVVVDLFDLDHLAALCITLGIVRASRECQSLVVPRRCPPKKLSRTGGRGRLIEGKDYCGKQQHRRPTRRCHSHPS
mmetsp:Transcript_1702/g.4100  ORF Transcript_1702/g.4100 Transcript_1702/m.4100 type:complete len:201 (-) Transcript_1702:151-753(-)